MEAVSITELRQELAAWIDRVRLGESVSVSVRGEIVARLVPPRDVRADAVRRLHELRSVATVGDVESPIDEAWSAGG